MNTCMWMVLKFFLRSYLPFIKIMFEMEFFFKLKKKKKHLKKVIEYSVFVALTDSNDITRALFFQRQYHQQFYYENKISFNNSSVGTNRELVWAVTTSPKS